MIEEIRIQSLGVIEASTMEIGPGLTVLTGETGAGKTMVVTALGLLLGGRADSGAVRTGAKRARVEGMVDATALPDFRSAVEEAGGEAEDDRVLLARNIAAEGRSRAQAGGASVPVATLARLAEPLVAVHGQSDQHRLLRPTAQRDALDRFAGDELAKRLTRWHEARRELQAVETELDDLVSHSRERAQEADLLRFGLDEVEQVSPQPGEDADLRAEESRLSFADSLRSAAEQAREALSAEHEGPDALGAVAAARRLLDGVREHDPRVAELADRLAEVGYLLTDVATDVASYATDVDTDPVRLASVSERRAALTALTRKYGDTVADVLAWAEEGRQRLLELDQGDDKVAQLRERRESLRAQLVDIGCELTDLRATAATALASTVSEELTLLAMPDARLEVIVTATEVDEPADPEAPGAPIRVGERWLRIGTHGIDEVEFRLAANAGSEPRPLARGASGGELSRVMLALEVALAGTSPVPTFVFDEVDAGVGGKAAVEIGRRLATLAREAQVIVVTHLPQVAAFADRHVVVAKASDGSVTTSGLTLLSEEERVRELSRMLAGMEESDTALAHARELLDLAQAGRA